MRKIREISSTQSCVTNQNNNLITSVSVALPVCINRAFDALLLQKSTLPAREMMIVNNIIEGDTMSSVEKDD